MLSDHANGHWNLGGLKEALEEIRRKLFGSGLRLSRLSIAQLVTRDFGRAAIPHQESIMPAFRPAKIGRF
jgi:hypothetical protein